MLNYKYVYLLLAILCLFYIFMCISYIIKHYDKIVIMIDIDNNIDNNWSIFEYADNRWLYVFVFDGLL